MSKPRTLPKDVIVDGLHGQYRVSQELSRGGLGVVYKAQNISTGKKVAIKVLHNDRFVLTDAIYLRFLREIQYGDALDHPNLVQTIDASPENDFLVMEFIEGEPLQKTYHSLTFSEKRTIADSILNGLSHIHQSGFLHRDIKPNNIMLTKEKQVKICDYGLLKKIDDEEPYITNTLDNLGSLLYVSENQRDNPSNVTPLDDIYSVAIVIYELFSNERMSVRWKPKKMIHAGVKLRQLVVSIIHDTHQNSPTQLIENLHDCVTDHSHAIKPVIDGISEVFGKSAIGDISKYKPLNSLGHDIYTFVEKAGIFDVNLIYDHRNTKRTLLSATSRDHSFTGSQLKENPTWKAISQLYANEFPYVINQEIIDYLANPWKV